MSSLEDVLTQAVERFSFLGRRRDAHNSLHHATSAFDMDDLLAKLEEARSYQVDSDVVRRSEDRVSTLRRMRAEAATELQPSLSVDPRCAAVDRSSATG